MEILNLDVLGKGLGLSGGSVAVFDDKHGAVKQQARVMVVPPEAPNQKLHYHTDREGWMLVLSGECKEVIEENGTLVDYLAKPGDIWFMPAKVNHRTENVGKTDLVMMELFSLPADFIVVE